MRFAGPRRLIALVVVPRGARSARPRSSAGNARMERARSDSAPGIWDSQAVLRTCRRLAWLADVTLAIDKQGGFPGGCRKESLARFTRLVYACLIVDRDEWDSLGRPTATVAFIPSLEAMADQLRRQSGRVQRTGQAA